MTKNIGLLSSEIEYSSNGTPEKNLLAAVLERSVRDLEPHIPINDTKCALKWFRLTSFTKYSERFHITFEDCVEGLNLSAQQIKTIKLKVINCRERLGIK